MSKLEPASKIKEKKPKRYVIDTTGIVSEMIQETGDTKTLRIKVPHLKEENKPFRFKPGQFVMVRPEINGKIVPRAYSISSSPTRSVDDDGYFDLTVRQTKKPTVSKWLNERKIGDEIPFRGPYGQFFWDEEDTDAEEIFMLGAGSGITPLKSILEYIHDKKMNNKITLIYSCRYENEIISRKELENLIENTSNAKLLLTLTREKEDSAWLGYRGRINKELIQQELNNSNFDLYKSKFYMCGTPSFVEFMTNILLELDIDRTHILHEKWD
ncbi:MAG: FAD-binding oxidoreductase [Candidatus Hodarchaeales archaeon]